MLIHVVCFKYRGDATEPERQDHRKRLQGLASLDGVIELRVGEDIVRSARSYDTALLVSFRDRAALDAYQIDPGHVPVAQFGQRMSEHIVAVDFET
jgi:hypothetical protein